MLEYRFSVYPQPRSIRSGDGFSLHIANLPFAEEVTHVSVDLARVEWEETSWWWQSGVKPVHQDGSLSVSFERLDVPTGVYVVSRLRFSLGPSENATNTIDAWPKRNFPRLFLQVADQPMQPVRGAELAERLRLVEEGREKVFRSGIVADPANPGIGRFRGFAFVTRCLLKHRMRLGQLEVIPLGTGLQSIEQAAIIKQVLAQFGAPVAETDDAWERASAQAFPLMVIHMPLIHARDRSEALAATIRYSLAVTDVLSPHRTSYGEPFAFVVESLDFPGRVWPVAAFDGYRGNVLGGFISGEDPPALKNDLLNVLAYPMLKLFVSLYRQAAAETNLDFAYFRFWNLLEAIATRRIEANKKRQVSTFDGQPLQEGKSISTYNDTARVYQLLKNHFQARELKQGFFLGGLRLQDLWSVCQVWWDTATLPPTMGALWQAIHNNPKSVGMPSRAGPTLR